MNKEASLSDTPISSYSCRVQTSRHYIGAAAVARFTNLVAIRISHTETLLEITAILRDNCK